MLGLVEELGFGIWGWVLKSGVSYEVCPAAQHERLGTLSAIKSNPISPAKAKPCE